MTPEIIKKIEPHYDIWTHFKVSGDFPDVSSDVCRYLAQVWKEAFNLTDKEVSKTLICSGCLRNMMKQLFNEYEAAMKQKAVEPVKKIHPNKKKV